MDKIICILILLRCIQIRCINVERKWRDFCVGVQCPKHKPTCGVRIGENGIPYCGMFGNDSVPVNIYKNQHGFYRLFSIKSVSILDGFNGWREIKYKSNIMRLKWSNKTSGRLLRVITYAE